MKKRDEGDDNHCYDDEDDDDGEGMPSKTDGI